MGFGVWGTRVDEYIKAKKLKGIRIGRYDVLREGDGEGGRKERGAGRWGRGGGRKRELGVETRGFDVRRWAFNVRRCAGSILLFRFLSALPNCDKPLRRVFTLGILIAGFFIAGFYLVDRWLIRHGLPGISGVNRPVSLSTGDP